MLVVDKPLKNFFDRISSKNKIGMFINFALRTDVISLLNNDEINHLSFGKSGMIDYSLNHKELLLSDNLEWLNNNRQQGKASKIIRKLINKECLSLFSEKDFEDFSNLYKSKGLDLNYEFQVVTGVDIHKTYLMEGVTSGGTLGNSCMRKNYKMFGIYVNNPHIVSLIRLVDKSKNKLCARALLWNLPDGKKFMDRIYTTEDYMVELFIEYACENNIDYRKANQNHTSLNDFIDLKTNTHVNLKLEIELNTDFALSPYLDTFRYGENGMIYNYLKPGYLYTYSNTSGGRNSNTSDSIFPTYEVDGEEDDNFVVIDGVRYPSDSDEICHSEEEGRYLLRSEAVWCVDIEDYVHEESEFYYNESDGNYYQSSDGLTLVGDYYYNDEVCVEIDDEYYLLTDDDIIELSNGTYVLVEDSVEVDGNHYHINSDEVIEDVDGDYILVEDSVIVNEGVYYNGDDRITLDIDGDYILIEDSVLINNNRYHVDDSRLTMDLNGNHILIEESVEIDAITYHHESPLIRLNDEGEYELV